MFGVYIHFPFCRKRCPYCDFAVSIRKEVPHEQYEEAILQEIERKKEIFPGRSLTSIYLGGGTPSLWKSECIERVLQSVFSTFPPQVEISKIEITLECDPLDLLDDSVMDWNQLKRIGINRLSVGVQSFQDHHLKTLGRLHSAKQAREAILQAKKKGFSNISLDIMIGIPNQSEEELLFDVEQVISLPLQHVSLYQLTVESGTALSAWVKKKKVVMPEDEQQAFFYQKIQEVLTRTGFEQYEISSYAWKDPAHQRDYRSAHNSLYWNVEEYVGIGVSAHSFRSLKNGAGERFSNTRNLNEYLGQVVVKKTKESFPILESSHQQQALYEYRSQADLAREALWLGLRQMEGVSCQKFTEKFGLNPLFHYQKELLFLQDRGWVEMTSEFIRLTRQGILFADEVGVYLV